MNSTIKRQAPRPVAKAPVNETRWVIPRLEDPAEQEIEDGSEEVNDPTKNVTNKIDNHGILLWDLSLLWLILVRTMQQHGPLTILLRYWEYVTCLGGIMQEDGNARRRSCVCFDGKRSGPRDTFLNWRGKRAGNIEIRH